MGNELKSNQRGAALWRRGVVLFGTSVLCLSACTGADQTNASNALQKELSLKDTAQAVNVPDVKNNKITDDLYANLAEFEKSVLMNERRYPGEHFKHTIDFIVLPLENNLDSYKFEHISIKFVRPAWVSESLWQDNLLEAFFQNWEDKSVAQVKSKANANTYHVKILQNDLFDGRYQGDIEELKHMAARHINNKFDVDFYERLLTDVNNESAVWLSIPIFGYQHPHYVKGSLKKLSAGSNCPNGFHYEYRKYISPDSGSFVFDFLSPYNVVEYQECSVFYIDTGTGHFNEWNSYFPYSRKITGFFVE